MQITKRLIGQTIELKIEGRIDGYWADHLAAAVDQEIRQGSHNIQLDLSQVAFLSSAGIGTLVRLYRDLKSIQGSFAVSNCSGIVLKVLELSRLVDLLVTKAPPESLLTNELSAGPLGDARVPTSSAKQVERSGALFEVYPLAPDSKLDCRRLGDATPLERCGFSREHCRVMQFSDSAFAIGLGALGENFEDCQGRFGEFVAAGGAVAYLPTDGTNVPDFLLARGTTLPEVQVCYGIACQGTNPQPFGSLIRFEAKKSGEPLALSFLLESCLDISDAQRIGVVMIAESAGLIGAALRRSPVLAASESNAFEFPRIRNWLSFTAERAYTKSVVLAAGVAVRGRAGALAPVVRTFPNGSGLPVSGHFHAAAFSYRPVQRGLIDLKASINSLFEGQTLEGILHLLSDDRALSGSGQSELIRGACWVAPISNITAEGAQA